MTVLLGVVLNAIIHYEPTQWRNGYCEILETLVEAMWWWWPAVRERALFETYITFGTLVMYYYRLDHHA